MAFAELDWCGQGDRSSGKWLVLRHWQAWVQVLCESYVQYALQLLSANLRGSIREVDISKKHFAGDYCTHFAVNYRWGSGKSFMIDLLKREFDPTFDRGDSSDEKEDQENYKKSISEENWLMISFFVIVVMKNDSFTVQFNSDTFHFKVCWRIVLSISWGIRGVFMELSPLQSRIPMLC